MPQEIVEPGNRDVGLPRMVVAVVVADLGEIAAVVEEAYANRALDHLRRWSPSNSSRPRPAATATKPSTLIRGSGVFTNTSPTSIRRLAILLDRGEELDKIVEEAH